MKSLWTAPLRLLASTFLLAICYLIYKFGIELRGSDTYNVWILAWLPPALQISALLLTWWVPLSKGWEGLRTCIVLVAALAVALLPWHWYQAGWIPQPHFGGEKAFRALSFCLAGGAAVVLAGKVISKHPKLRRLMWPDGNTEVDALRSFETVLKTVWRAALIVFGTVFWSEFRGWVITDDQASLRGTAILCLVFAFLLFPYFAYDRIKTFIGDRVVMKPQGEIIRELTLSGQLVCFGLALISLILLGTLISVTGGLISPFVFLFATFVSVTATSTERLFYPVTILFLCLWVGLSVLNDKHAPVENWPGFAKAHLWTFFLSLALVIAADFQRNRGQSG